MPLPFVFTAIIVVIIAALLVAGFSIFLSADNGTDFVDSKETYQALGGCGLILVALVIVSIFVYTAIS